MLLQENIRYDRPHGSHAFSAVMTGGLFVSAGRVRSAHVQTGR